MAERRVRTVQASRSTIGPAYAAGPAGGAFAAPASRRRRRHAVRIVGYSGWNAGVRPSPGVVCGQLGQARAESGTGRAWPGRRPGAWCHRALVAGACLRPTSRDVGLADLAWPCVSASPGAQPGGRNSRVEMPPAASPCPKRTHQGLGPVPVTRRAQDSVGMRGCVVLLGRGVGIPSLPDIIAGDRGPACPLAAARWPVRSWQPWGGGAAAC